MNEWARGRKHWSLRPSGEASYVFTNMFRGRAALRVLTPSRAELDGSFYFFAEEEELEDSNVIETAMLGTFGISGRFAQHSTVQFRTGLKFLHWNYEGDSANGVALTYGFDFFPGKPIVGSVNAMIGPLGDKGSVFYDVRGTLGFLLERAEIYAGYDFMGIDDVHLGGPVVGFRFWL